MYKLIKNLNDSINCVLFLETNTSIPFAVSNSDYAKFKEAVLKGAELLDADGKAMTSAQAIAFVKELP